jgi:hypothetical protein
MESASIGEGRMMNPRLRQKSQTFEDRTIAILVRVSDQKFKVWVLAVEICGQAFSDMIHSATGLGHGDQVDQRTGGVRNSKLPVAGGRPPFDIASPEKHRNEHPGIFHQAVVIGQSLGPIRWTRPCPATLKASPRQVSHYRGLESIFAVLKSFPDSNLEITTSQSAPAAA